MADTQHVDTLIVGAGLSGLVTALYLNELEPNSDILVIDKKSFPVKEMSPVILDPVSRNMLHSIACYKDYDFNEGRYKVFTLVNYNTGIRIKSEDTAIIPYSNLIYTLYTIAVLNNIPVHLKSEVLSIDYDNKYVITQSGIKLAYDNIINATGVHAKSKIYNIDWSNPIIDEDQYEYNITVSAKPVKTGLSVLQPVNINCPKALPNCITVGDAGGYVDFFTYCNSNLTIASAITAAKILAEHLPVSEYYKRMNVFTNHILGSIALRDHSPLHNEEFNNDLSDVLLHGDKSYAELYNKYVKSNS